ncbi:hypothetical protein Q9Q99_13015 [Curtobacterium flaccumfaciens]|nr:hypothetical protein Q9Q99_13015 [Curtobacterium flaccumfaciens]
MRVGRAGGLHGEAVDASADVQDPGVEEPPGVVGHDDGIVERLLHERDLVVIESGVPQCMAARYRPAPTAREAAARVRCPDPRGSLQYP